MEDDLQLDTFHLLFVDEVIAYDHLRQEVRVMVNLHVPENRDEEETKRRYNEARKRIMELVEIITKPSKGLNRRIENIPLNADLPSFSSNMNKEEFCGIVEKAKEYIAAGDIFQVVLSQPFSTKTDVDPFCWFIGFYV